MDIRAAWMMGQGTGLRQGVTGVAAFAVSAVSGRLVPAHVALVAIGLASVLASAQANPALDAGRQAYTGASALVAHMPGHSQPLPSTAARCINCHGAPGLPSAPAGSLGPRLDAAHLLQAQPRRGGPPSRYDADSLCRALRAGVDPAGVMLAGAMPRYRIDDSTCRQIWALLTADLR